MIRAFIEKYTNPIKYGFAALCFVAAAGAGVYVVRSYNSAIETATAAKEEVATLTQTVTVLRRDYGAATRRIDAFDAALREQAAQAQRMADLAQSARAETRALNAYFASGKFKENFDAAPAETTDLVNRDFTDAFGVWDCLTRSPATCPAEGSPASDPSASPGPD